MVVNVIMNDDYTFKIELDDGLKDMLKTVAYKRDIDVTAIMAEVILGGLTMQEHLFIHPDKSGT